MGSTGPYTRKGKMTAHHLLGGLVYLRMLYAVLKVVVSHIRRKGANSSRHFRTERDTFIDEQRHSALGTENGDGMGVPARVLSLSLIVLRATHLILFAIQKKNNNTPARLSSDDGFGRRFVFG